MRNSHLEIKNAIKKGMSKACEDMESFCAEPDKQFNAEYLFTVATAREISKLNGPSADPYRIEIEWATKTLQRDCLQPYLRPKGNTLVKGATISRHKNPIPNVSRNGRVDIAVYAEGQPLAYLGKKPLCVIELKGFNPAKRLVLEDVRRNLEFHRLIGATGKSVLSFSFFAALHSTSDFSTDALLVKRKWYKDLLAQLGQIDDFSLEIDTFTVSLDSEGRLQEELNEVVIDTSTIHHYIGVVVEIKKLSPVE